MSALSVDLAPWVGLSARSAYHLGFRAGHLAAGLERAQRLAHIEEAGTITAEIELVLQREGRPMGSAEIAQMLGRTTRSQQSSVANRLRVLRDQGRVRLCEGRVWVLREDT